MEPPATETDNGWGLYLQTWSKCIWSRKKTKGWSIKPQNINLIFYKFAFLFFLAYIFKKSNYHGDHLLGCLLQSNLWVADWLRPVWRPWLRRSNYLTEAIGLIVSYRGWRVPYRFPSLWSWRTWWCWWAAAGPERKHGPESPQSTPTSPVRRPDTRSPCSEAA